MTMKDDILIKLGGSILENPQNLESTLNQFKNLVFSKNKINRVIILPGGGSYANFIRTIDVKLNIGEDLSHWMAILAMEKNANELYKRYKEELILFNDFQQLKLFLDKNEERKMLIFAPFDFLYQTDTLPHSWKVTSDSIAGYLAYNLNLKRCFLIKDIDGIIDKDKQIMKKVSSRKLLRLIQENRLYKLASEGKEGLKKSKPVDTYLLNLINEYGLHCFILNGKYGSKNISEFFSNFQEDSKKYTEIFPS
jgi:5-(aminomethyl)-3-furanmethanol phosphate kinase